MRAWWGVTDDGASGGLWRRSRALVPALVVVCIGLLLTGYAWRAAARADDRLTRERFSHAATIFLEALERHQRLHEAALSGGAALISVMEPDARRWRALFRTMRTAERHPGVQGFGYAPLVRADELAAHEAAMRAQGVEGYKVTPPGAREVYTPIVFIEPDDWRNRRARGFDMSSEPVRRAVMERARDTGATQATGRVRLRQETDDEPQPGFLLYAPVYRDLPAEADYRQRRAALMGFAYSPIRATDYFDAVLRQFETEAGRFAAVEIFDGPSLEPAARLYQSGLADVEPNAVSVVRPHDVFGATWRVRLTALPGFNAGYDPRLQKGIAVAGVLVSLLLGALAAMVVLRNEQQEQVARHKDVIARELSHRVKNLLTVIQSIAGRSFVDGRPLAEARQVFADRIAALARVHSALLDSRWSGASLDEIVRGELAPFGGRASIVGPPLQVQPQMAQHLAMALHELATNATKHGALSTPGGSVRVEWTTRVADGERLFAFAWSETGGPPVLPPSREGFGQTLLRRILASTIAAQPAIDYAPEGLRYSFECPLSRVAVDGRTA